jgi:16S rRNA (guanine1516-N2)-methyltransferase
MIQPSTNVAVFTDNPALLDRAQSLAFKLGLAVTDDKNSHDYLLIVTTEHLALQKTQSNSLPLVIDFLSGQLTYRSQHASLKKESLARALGLKHKNPCQIIDATAGLGRDSFILASLGFEVTLLERSPIIHELLQDALARARQNTKASPIIARMQLIQANALDALPALAKRPELIYLDPMFPDKTKSAMVKKEMQMFQDVVGDDADGTALLKTALACATLRVVVKRPRLASWLGDLKPSFSHTGSSSRFDVYLLCHAVN